MSGAMWHAAADAVLILAVMAAVWAWRGKTEEARDLRAALDASCERVEQLRDDLRLQAETLSERDAKIKKLSGDKTRLSRLLREASEDDDEVKAWMDGAVPPAVRGMLGGAGGAGDTGAAPGAVRDAGVRR